MQQEWSRHKNILIIRPDNMGDILMSTPAIHALASSSRDKHITLLTSKKGAAVAPLLTDIDDVIVADLPWVSHTEKDDNTLIQQTVAKLKKRNFDAAVIFTVYSQSPLPSAMLCSMAGIKHIAAYCRENPYSLISHWIPDHEPFYKVQHQVIRDLELVKSLGIPAKRTGLKVHLPHTTNKDIKNILEKYRIDQKKPYIILHPGASEERRQYPVAQFAEAGRLLATKHNYQIVITGTAHETPLLEVIQDRVGSSAIVCNDISIEDFAILIKHSKCLISNNTGPVHIAAALKTPVVVMYALTNPQHLPWKTSYRALFFDVPAEKRSQNILLQYTYDRFFKKINTPSPDMIVKAVTNLMKGKSDNPSDTVELS